MTRFLRNAAWFVFFPLALLIVVLDSMWTGMMDHPWGED